MIVQHPETVGSGPQLFQTFTVHRSPVTKIMLSEKHLVSGTVGLLAGLLLDRQRERTGSCSGCNWRLWLDLAWVYCTDT